MECTIGSAETDQDAAGSKQGQIGEMCFLPAAFCLLPTACCLLFRRVLVRAVDALPAGDDIAALDLVLIEYQWVGIVVEQFAGRALEVGAELRQILERDMARAVMDQGHECLRWYTGRVSDIRNLQTPPLTQLALFDKFIDPCIDLAHRRLLWYVLALPYTIQPQAKSMHLRSVHPDRLVRDNTEARLGCAEPGWPGQ